MNTGVLEIEIDRPAATVGAGPVTSATARESAIAVHRGPGRPRDDALDEQIIDATLALIDAEEAVTVARIVELSGVSRAALYRRWPSSTAIVAAALDFGRVVPPDIPTDGDLRAGVVAVMVGDPASVTATGYSDVRFRHRIRLVMADRALQKAYWSSHVARRRVPLESAFRVGIERGILRADLDVEACFDAISGAAYHQIVVRGDRFEDSETKVRLHAAFDVIWRGMSA
ncbi:AcrR family transcriptional regulator [Rhodococcus sp. 27YEA15]|uniref:TetR/AcrR family transcriptional regulator n=1 Tax=Rhodococcus sp. 27YEA15 TaxID=3156259 RepID=UPI003C7C7E5A